MSNVIKIDVYQINVGCPPEHWKQYVKSIEVPSDIASEMQSVLPLGLSPTRQQGEGGVCYLYVLKYDDGSEQEIVMR